MEKEFVPLIDTDKIAYETLARCDSVLLIRIKEAMAEGANAAFVERWAKSRIRQGTVRDMAIGAAHYIERAGKAE